MMLVTHTESEARKDGGMKIATDAPKIHPLENAEAGSERRRGLRIRQNRPLKIFDATTCRFFGGQTEDLSATGLRIELPLSTPVMVGSLVHVHVGVSNSGEPLANRKNMMAAKIVWIRRDHNLANNRLTAGIEFVSGINAGLQAA
jgi:hypothetical protein